MKKLISDFLKKFCVLVEDGKDVEYSEIYADNHTMIQYEDKIYYMPEDNSMYTEDDEFLRDVLIRLYDFC